MHHEHDHISWKIIYVATIFSFIVLGIAYYLISPRSTEYFNEEKTDKLAEFNSTNISGRKHGKKIWEFPLTASLELLLDFLIVIRCVGKRANNILRNLGQIERDFHHRRGNWRPGDVLARAVNYHARRIDGIGRVDGRDGLGGLDGFDGRRGRGGGLRRLFLPAAAGNQQ